LSQENQFPAAFVLELAAVIQLQVWQDHEFGSDWPADLPTYDAARQDLIDRAKEGIYAYQNIESATLSMQAMRFHLTRLAWDSPLMGNCKMVIAIDDEEAFVEAMARFLFDNRTFIDKLLLKD
jgi:hypothetical protein